MIGTCLSVEGLTAECSGDSLVVISPEKKIIYLNLAARRLLDLDEKRSLADLTCCDVMKMDICGGECPSSKATRKGEFVNSYFVRRKDSDRVFCVSTSLLCDDAGNKLGVIHSIKDMALVNDLIAERGRAQDKLQRNRAHLQAILDSLADGMFTADTQGRITHFSRSMERIIGLEAADVIGKNCHEVLRGTTCETACPIRQSLRDNIAVEGHQELLSGPGGSSVPVSITTSMLREGEQVSGIVCSVRDRTEVEQLRRQLRERCFFPELVGGCKKMLDLYELIDGVCKTDITVLIQGETGVGKEMVARAIHQISNRHAGPFVTVNCAVHSPYLLESELFGHARGAFTGAVKDRVGKFEIAEGGTLFLDEISETPLDFQVKLLRFLERKEFERVGESEARKVDARIIAATNRPLQEMVGEGAFRKDLFYRLQVVPITVPPLRERKEDIPLLVEHFIIKHRKLNREVEGVATAALQSLIECDWPGNVRQLESVVIFALSSCDGKRIERRHLPPDIRKTPKGRQAVKDRRRGESPGVSIYPDPMALEKDRIVQALKENNWRVGKAASALGYHRTTLWRRVQGLGIRLPNR